MIKMSQNEVAYIHKKMNKQKPNRDDVLEFVHSQRGKFWKRVEEWAKDGMKKKYVVQECFGNSKPTKECIECNNYDVCADAFSILKTDDEVVVVKKRERRKNVGHDRKGRDIIKSMCHDVLQPLIGTTLTSAYNSKKSISVLRKFSETFSELNLEKLVREWCDKNNQVFDEVWNTVSYKIYYYTRRIIKMGTGIKESVDDKERITKAYQKSVTPVLQKRRYKHNEVDGRVMQLLAHDILKPLVGVKLNYNGNIKSTTVLRKLHEMFPELGLEKLVKDWCDKNNQVFNDVWNTRKTSDMVYYFARKILKGDNKGDKNEGE